MVKAHCEAVHSALLRPLSQQDLERLLLPILSEEQQKCIDQQKDVAFTYVFDKDSLVRLSVSKECGKLKMSAHWLEVEGA